MINLTARRILVLVFILLGHQAISFCESPFIYLKDFKNDSSSRDYTQALIDAQKNHAHRIILPPETIEISSPIAISSCIQGSGAYPINKSVIRLVGDGQLIVAEDNVEWNSFTITSPVNSKTFVICQSSYWTFNNFMITREDTKDANGTILFRPWAQRGIQFDLTAKDIYFTSLENFKFQIDYPIFISGSKSFNANKLGGTVRDYWREFKSAITFQDPTNMLSCAANQIAGYFEKGINAITIDNIKINPEGSSFYSNRFDICLDTGVDGKVTRLLNTSVNINLPNWWRTNVLTYGGGAGIVSNQFIDNKNNPTPIKID